MKLEKAYKKMLIENPFYGIFLLGIAKVLDKNIPTACVRRKGINCEFVVNPDYWDTLTDHQQMNLLSHEVYHIVFQHMFLYELFPNKQVLNIAADCEVNSYLTNVDNGVTPAMFHLPEKKGTKFYYEKLMKQNPQKEDQENGGQSGNDGMMDDHSSWKEFQECSSAEKQLMDNQIKAQLKNTAEQIYKTRGSIPRELKEVVEELFKLKPRVFDWKSYFRRILGSMYDVEIKKTRRKESIRFPDSAGINHKKKVNILVAIDTSGSLNSEDVADFFSEVTHIYKAGAKITIVECDTKINAQYEFNGIWTKEIHGRGGTDFQPVIDFYRKNLREYSSLIYFTDGEAPLPVNVPRGTLWIITSDGAHKDYPGKTVYIPKHE